MSAKIPFLIIPGLVSHKVVRNSSAICRVLSSRDWVAIIFALSSHKGPIEGRKKSGSDIARSTNMLIAVLACSSWTKLPSTKETKTRHWSNLFLRKRFAHNFSHLGDELLELFFFVCLRRKASTSPNQTQTINKQKIDSKQIYTKPSSKSQPFFVLSSKLNSIKETVALMQANRTLMSSSCKPRAKISLVCTICWGFIASVTNWLKRENMRNPHSFSSALLEHSWNMKNSNSGQSRALDWGVNWKTAPASSLQNQMRTKTKTQ